MKKVISALCFVALGLTHDFSIRVSRNEADASRYQLACDGAHGTVRYYAEGLPRGVEFSDSTLVVTNNAQFGTFNIRVRATDDAGQSAERIITLTISQAQAAGTTGGAVGGATGGVAGGATGATGGVAPTGATGGVAPTGATGATGTSPSNNGRLSSLISTYSSTDVTRPDYGTSGRYPEPNLPTGNTQNLPNPTTIGIANDQAPTSPANRNTITSDDVALRAASERHQNAIKGITNLLKIIDQAKANRDKAQSDIQTYTQAYNDAVTAQRAAQNDIIAAETKVSQIVSAINSLTATIDDLRNKIAQAVAQRDALSKEKTTLTSNISNLEGTKAGLLEKLKGLDTEVAARVQDLSNKGAECSAARDAANAKQKELDEQQRILDANNAARPGAVADITAKTGIVDDLRKRLQDAEKDLADAKIRLADIDAVRLSLPVKIAGLQKELADLLAKAKACADEVARIQALIDNLKGNKYPDLTNQIKDLDDKIGGFRTRVSEIDAQLAASQGPLEDLRAKLAQAQEDLTFVRSQKGDADNALRLAYQRGNDANNRVAFAKQNLDAVIKRFQDESKIVSDANLNLERARAEEALARLGLEELIAHYSDALPYAIVPNGNGVGSGTPYGNNPSGSALGPINTNGNGASGSFKVNSWTNYLSSAYGAGVNPAFTGSVTELFPFNFLSTVNGNNINNGYRQIRGEGREGGNVYGAGGCGGQGIGARVTTGAVVAVRANSFDVKQQDGKVFTVNVAPCTQLNANRADYIMQTGHQAVVKGVQAAGKDQQLNAAQVTCLQ